MHPIIAGLSEKRRRELLGYPDFVALSEDRKVQLLDEVLKVRESLDDDERLAAFSDQRRRMADAEELKDALATALTVLGRNRQIGVDMIDGLADHHRGSIDEAMIEERACMQTMRRMLAAVDRLAAEPQERTSRRGREARLLRWALADFGIGVKMTTPRVRGNPSLAFLGLLADPPASPDAILKSLRR
jgi:hypothetical protein